MARWGNVDAGDDAKQIQSLLADSGYTWTDQSGALLVRVPASEASRLVASLGATAPGGFRAGEKKSLEETERLRKDAPDASAPASVIDVGIDIDRSGYNYDLVLTYKMIEDTADQDTLFRIQFLQAFGITDDEYHPDIVSAVIDDLYERFRENPGIRTI